MSQSGNRPVLLTLFAIVLVDICGYTIVLPLLPFYAEHFHATPFQVGSIISLFALAQMISGPILGRLSDRYGRRPILIVSQVGTLVSFIILAQARTLWMVFFARAVDGLTAGNLTVAQAYVADVTTREQRTKAMGLIGAAFGIGFVLGPSLCAFFSGLSVQAPIWAASVLSLGAIIGSVFLLRDSKHHLAQDDQPLHGSPKPSLPVIFADPMLRWPLISFFFFCLMFSMAISGLALFSERVLVWDHHPFGQREVGWVFTIGGMVGLIIQSSLIGPSVRKGGERAVAALAFISVTLGFILIGSSPVIWIFLLGYVLVQGGSSFIRPTINGLISKNAPRGAQGYMFGITQTLMAMTQIVAPLISGALIENQLYSIWAWLSGVIGLIGLAAILALPKRSAQAPTNLMSELKHNA